MSTTYTAKKRFWNKKKAVVAGIAATFLIPAAAWAAVTFFGFSSFSASAAESGTISITSTSLANTLAPGQSVGVRGNVKNTNDYPITVKSVILKVSTLSATGGTPAECQVTPHVRGTSTPYPNTDGTFQAAGTGIKYTLTTPVLINPGDNPTITVPNVITQAASATKLCGVAADYAVEFSAGS